MLYALLLRLLLLLLALPCLLLSLLCASCTSWLKIFLQGQRQGCVTNLKAAATFAQHPMAGVH
jgi:hypothetical protein